MESSRPALSFALAALVAATGCDRVNAATDRALAKFQMKDACPEPTPGKVAGTETPEPAFGCFQQAVSEKSPQLLARVTCKSRQPASCKQTDATEKELGQALSDLGKLDWSASLGSFADGAKVTAFVVDTHPKEKRVSVVYVCRIAEGDRWAVCDTGEMPRDAAEKKLAK